MSKIFKDLCFSISIHDFVGGDQVKDRREMTEGRGSPRCQNAQVLWHRPEVVPWRWPASAAMSQPRPSRTVSQFRCWTGGFRLGHDPDVVKPKKAGGECSWSLVILGKFYIIAIVPGIEFALAMKHSKTRGRTSRLIGRCLGHVWDKSPG